MPESYPDQLAAYLRAKNEPGRAMNIAEFRTAKADVVSALEAGFLCKDIWRNLRACKRISFSYDTFLRMVKLHLPDMSVAHTRPKSSRENRIPDKVPSLPASNSPTKPSVSPRGFVFNPIPIKDDLI